MEKYYNLKLQQILTKYNINTCHKCGRVIDRGDIMWNEGSTEYGTPYLYIYIECQQCDTEIFYGWSWDCNEYSFRDLIDEGILEDMLENKNSV